MLKTRLRLGLVLAGVVVSLAAGSVIAARAMSAPATSGTALPPTPAPLPSLQALNAQALADLSTLKGQLGFRPWLPPNLGLPAGHSYVKVTWSSAPPVTGFGLFISGTDATAGTRAIHVDEAAATPQSLASPRNPLNAFQSVLRPVSLANGTWYEMQQQHQPWQGEWILTTQLGGVGIEIDGLDSKAQLEQFAGSLVLG
ncbi:MAG: hypothetical protein ACREN2_08455 [Candidatus Dormibacteria bacterium]